MRADRGVASSSVQPQQAPQKKKSGNGCLIALAIVGGLVLLGVGVAAFAVYRLSQTKEGKMIFGAIGEMTKIIAEAQTAPGAEEVRKLGCDQGMVLDMDKMTRLFSMLDASAPPSGQFSVMVMCQVGFTGTPPSCDDVARTYHAAAGPPPRGFVATVQRSGGHAAVCSTLYTPAGGRVRDMDTHSTPAIPMGK
jgi:hypothetical protein